MKKYLLEGLMFTAYALFAASWVSGAMLTPAIQASFGEAGFANATWGSNVITLAKIVGNLVAAALLMRLGAKRAFALAMLLIATGGLGALAGSYGGWLLSRLALGLGGALAIVYFNPVVLHYFSARERPLINGINAAAFNTGNLLALLTTAALAAWMGGWQSVIALYGVMVVALALLWWLAAENFPLSGGGDQPEENYGLAQGVREPFNWWLPLAYCGVLFCYIAVFALFPLIDGFAVASKDLSAVMIFAGMVGTAAGILVTKRYPLRLPVLRYSGLALVLFAALMLVSRNPIVAYAAAALAGFFMFLPMTALVTLPQELPGMTPARITVTFGMFWSVSYGVETALMYGAGLLADSTGEPAYAAYFAVACSASLFVFSFLLPESGKKNEVREKGAENATA
ncbi:MFS transporter [Microbulbifer thermotolerans]|uniref:MFS transporter n=1 Tax=Microbulbifer thermotolerans TaxID=252514 RepID=UPI002248B70D|nr:MFS transporter [Microbulbifer thermotolerans]MCX2781077.1 MFS transporter [Microbulbifer thermotolerans]MCX2806394.1 MFS transporter [Microbulbifer thermotolerans]MCX2832955.1 MFS transporter [Microbulbifer thermotolerans]MCX2842108.1 MFS transporter [Microbulbifer thermotolerans]WKT60309.1 MFS transporter [Microbulbifer thermotolerans]